MIGFFQALLRAIRGFFSRWAARRLIAQQLPRGLPPAPGRPFLLALRLPSLPDDAPAGEFWTLPLLAQSIRGRPPARLLRLSALPPLLPRLDVLRPDRLRLDDALRLPVEVDPPRLASDAPPPARERRVRPRTPIARAPVHRLRQRNFRLDPRTGRPANEGIVPLERREAAWHWVLPTFRREKLDTRWMARERISFLGPLQPEWFAMWWLSKQERRPGAKDPCEYELPRELWDALDQVKEQMLIRRDVKKDEDPPPPQEFYVVEVGQPIAAREETHLSEVVQEKEWVKATTLDPLPLDRAAREAYLQWRTLVDALEER